MLSLVLCLAGFVGLLSSACLMVRFSCCWVCCWPFGIQSFWSHSPRTDGPDSQARVLCHLLVLLVAVLWLGPPLWWGVCAGAWHASMVRRALLVRYPPPWSGVLCWCRAIRHAGACCATACPVAIVGHVCFCVANLDGRACIAAV